MSPSSGTSVGSQDAAAAAAHEALLESDRIARALTDAIPHMLWSTLPDGFHDYYNSYWYEYTGVPPGSTDGEGWNGMFHEADRERAWAIWRRCLETGEPYEIEYRLRHRSGQYRWVLGRAMPMRNESGEIVRWMGTCTDIHEQKAQADHNEILSRELSHRIKNIFAVIGGLIGLSARRTPAHRTFAAELQARIAALGRAHEFVRPHSERSRPMVVAESLQAMFRDILSPYPAMAEGRIAVIGEDFRIDDRSATPLALLIHELATNAMKYGALSSDQGTVELSSERDGEDAVLTWRETGGPEIAGPPQHEGFGTRLAELSVEGQLGGELRREWLASGIVTQARMPVTALARGAASGDDLAEQD